MSDSDSEGPPDVPDNRLSYAALGGRRPVSPSAAPGGFFFNVRPQGGTRPPDDAAEREDKRNVPLDLHRIEIIILAVEASDKSSVHGAIDRCECI